LPGSSVRRLQADAAAKSRRAFSADFEANLPEAERDRIHRGIRRGLKDIEAGRFKEYDADGLRRLGKELVARSARKHASRTKAG
jgi:hypothetical protein